MRQPRLPPRPAEQDSALPLMDLLCNALVAIMVLALLALARMGPGGAEIRGVDEGRERRRPVHGFRSDVSKGSTADHPRETVVLVQLATGQGADDVPLDVLVDGRDASTSEVRLVQGAGRQDDPAPLRQRAALLLTPMGTARRFDVEVQNAEGAVGLAWKVVVGRAVVLAGHDVVTPLTSGRLLTVCVDESGAVSSALRGSRFSECRGGV